MSIKDLELKIINMANSIAKELSKGKDIEIKKNGNDIKILSTDKKIVK